MNRKMTGLVTFGWVISVSVFTSVAVPPSSSAANLIGTWEVGATICGEHYAGQLTISQGFGGIFSGTASLTTQSLSPPCPMVLSGDVNGSAGDTWFSFQLTGSVLVDFGGTVSPDRHMMSGSTFTDGFIPGDFSAWRYPVCGDGVLYFNEQCDDGNLIEGDCCNGLCMFELDEPWSLPCGDDLNPCTEERCSSGVCTTRPGPAGIECRPSAGVCDAAETCDFGGLCPPDSKRRFELCRFPAGVCDVAEVCDGDTDDCPPDAKSTDVCRTSAGGCDFVERCDGAGNDCPADGPQPGWTSCWAVSATISQASYTGHMAFYPHPGGGLLGAGSFDCSDCSTHLNGDISVSLFDTLVRFQLTSSTAVFFEGAVSPDRQMMSGATFTDGFIPGDFSAWRYPVCGDGVLYFAEQCDDGNLINGDCCDGLCMFELDEPWSLPCGDDLNPCTEERCSSGVCTTRPGPAGIECRPSAGVCDAAETCDFGGLCPPDSKRRFEICRFPAGVCDVAEVCDGDTDDCPPDAKSTDVCRTSAGSCDVVESCDGAGNDCPADAGQADGTSCSDGLFCNGSEQCENGVCQGGLAPCGIGCNEIADDCGCPAVAQGACRTAGKSMLLLKNHSDDGKDKLLWKWLGGQATSAEEFGDPGTDTEYRLCMYTGAARGLVADGDSRVGPGPGWVPTSTGWQYTDSAGEQDGLRKVQLHGSTRDKAKILVKGKGTSLRDPTLPILATELPLVVQIFHDQAPVCWESTFGSDAVIKNDVDAFRAKTDLLMGSRPSSAGHAGGGGGVIPIET